MEARAVTGEVEMEVEVEVEEAACSAARRRESADMITMYRDTI